MTKKQDCTIPRHVAFIMVGNGRWAKKQGKSRIAGLREGAERLNDVLEVAMSEGIEVVSLFAFSTENWNRPKEEVDQLMKMFSHFLQHKISKLEENHIQLRVIGDVAGFSKKLQKQIKKAVDESSHYQKFTLIIAANYGGQWDIVEATKKIAQKVVAGQATIDEITPLFFSQHLSFSDLPNPDLLVRTSGEIRISNFFLWQLAYTELYFTDIYWPDFNKEAFQEALKVYAMRCRRFGKTSEQIEDSNV